MEAASLLSELDPKASAAVFEEMWPEAAAPVLELVPPDQAERAIRELKIGRTAALLHRLSPQARERIVEALDPPLRTRVYKALALPFGTAGSAADSTITPFDAEATVGEAVARGLDQRLPYIYVVDRDYRLVGVLHRRELEGSKSGTVLRTIMTTSLQKVPAATPVVELHQLAAWSTLDALPVVDAQGTFLGVVRHKALRAIQPPAAGPYKPATALETLLDLGEVYWTGLFSAIELLTESGRGVESEDLT